MQNENTSGPAATSGDAPADLAELNELALAAHAEAKDRGEWFNVYQLCDGVTLDACAAFIAATDPALVLYMIERLARIERAAAPAPTADDMRTMTLNVQADAILGFAQAIADADINGHRTVTMMAESTAAAIRTKATTKKES